MVTGYRQRSLADELQGARDVLDAAGIAFAVTRDSVPAPAPVDSLLAWTVREGITNVLRHSRAHHCEVSLEASNSGFTVAIVDDGVGGVASAGGSGLHGLRERVGAAGGHLEAGPGRARWVPPAGVRSSGGDVIHVLIAEDQGMVRGALATLLALEEDIDVVAQCSRGDEVVAAALAAQPDVALLDIEMPGLDGLQAAGLLHQALPACTIIILTDLRAARLSAPGHGGGRNRVRRQGRSRRPARDLHPPRGRR